MDNFLEDEYLDNQSQDESNDDELLESEEPTNDEPRRGNLAAALKEERERRKQQDRELADLRSAQEKTNALLAQFGQQRQQVDQSQYREQLRDKMFDAPDEVLAARDQQLERRVLQRMAPLAMSSAQNYLATHPEYKDVYSIPQIKDAVDRHIQNAAMNYGSVDLAEVEQSLKGLVSLAGVLGGTKPQIADSGKSKLNSTVTKTSSGSRQSLSDEEIVRKAYSTLSPKELVKWEKDPKNRELVNRVMFKNP